MLISSHPVCIISKKINENPYGKVNKLENWNIKQGFRSWLFMSGDLYDLNSNLIEKNYESNYLETFDNGIVYTRCSGEFILGQPSAEFAKLLLESQNTILTGDYINQCDNLKDILNNDKSFLQMHVSDLNLNTFIDTTNLQVSLNWRKDYNDKRIALAKEIFEKYCTSKYLSYDENEFIQTILTNQDECWRLADGKVYYKNVDSNADDIDYEYKQEVHVFNCPVSTLEQLQKYHWNN